MVLFDELTTDLSCSSSRLVGVISASNHCHGAGRATNSPPGRWDAYRFFPQGFPGVVSRALRPTFLFLRCSVAGLEPAFALVCTLPSYP